MEINSLNGLQSFTETVRNVGIESNSPVWYSTTLIASSFPLILGVVVVVCLVWVGGGGVSLFLFWFFFNFSFFFLLFNFWDK